MTAKCVHFKVWRLGTWRVTRVYRDGVEAYIIVERWSEPRQSDQRHGHWKLVTHQERQLRERILMAYEAATKPPPAGNDNDSQLQLFPEGA